MRGELRVVAGKNPGKVVCLAGEGRVQVGRAQTNDFTVDDPAVSRIHCAIVIEAGGCVLEDLGSFHGTHLNGQRIEGRVSLSHEDRIRVGSTELKLLLSVEQEEEILTGERCTLCGAPLDGGAGRTTCKVCETVGSEGEKKIESFMADDSSLILDGIADIKRQQGDPRFAPPTVAPRYRLGPYGIHQALGRGSMGVVYKAWESGVERWVALKVLRAERMSSVEDKRRFLREARVGLDLRHPGIVRCFDYGVAVEAMYLTLEYLDGDDLHTLRRRRGRIEIPTALEWAAELLDALAHAHERQVVHRDLKPGNVMLQHSGGLKILDFGLAKAAELSGGKLTAEGAVLGTPVFMPPEQLRGSGKVDHRADLYAVAALLYNLVTGELPFPGGRNVLRVARSIIHEPPLPVSRFLADAPPGLQQMMDVGLAKQPEERFQTAGEMRRAAIGLREQLA